MKRNLTKPERLSKTKDIKKAFTQCQQASAKGIKLLYRPNLLTWNRILLSPVRNFGSAVERNRSKRLLRETYRQLKETIKPGYDLVFIPFPGKYLYAQRKDQMIKVLASVGLLFAQQNT